MYQRDMAVAKIQKKIMEMVVYKFWNQEKLREVLVEMPSCHDTTP